LEVFPVGSDTIWLAAMPDAREKGLAGHSTVDLGSLRDLLVRGKKTA
jgi:hypothetical protein